MTAKITFLPNGPVKIEGSFELKDAAGRKVTPTTQSSSGEHVYLCRCGHSGKKPFCDGSHGKAGFKAD